MGILRVKPDFDHLRTQDIPELFEQDDVTLLAWAAEQQRIILTHDVRTLTKFAYDRVRAGEYMPGVIEVNDQAALGPIVDNLMLIIEASSQEECENLIEYLPFS